MKFIFLFLFPFLITATYAKVIEKVMATVDEEIILLSAVKSHQKLIKLSIPYSNILFEIYSKKNLKKNKKSLLNYLIDKEILKKSILLSQLNIPTSDQILKQTLKKHRLSKKTLIKKLKRTSITLKEYQDLLFDNEAIKAFFYAEAGTSIHVSYQDISDFYFSKYKKKLSNQYQYDFYQWEFPFDTEGRKKANEFSKNLLNAHSSSTSISKKKLKSLAQSQIQTDIRQTLSKLLIGNRSKPLCINNQCYVFELVNKQPLFVHNQKTKNIHKKLQKQKLRNQITNWINQKRKEFIIKKYI